MITALLLGNTILKGAEVKIKVINDDPINFFVTHNVPPKSKADIAAKFTDLNSPSYLLEQAIIKNSISGVKNALNFGANIFKPCSNGMSPLLLSIILRHTPITIYLLDQGAYADRNCIKFALKNHDRNLAYRLLSTRKAYFDKLTVYSAYAQYSFNYTFWDCITKLKKSSSRFWDIKPSQEEQRKSLHIRPNAQKIIKLMQEMLHAGYAINDLWNAQVNGSLWLLAYDKQASKDIIDFLKLKGAQVNHVFYLKNVKSMPSTPLLQAIAAENIYAVKTLLNWGADANQEGYNSDCSWCLTPLAYALQKDSQSMHDIIKLLIEHGAHF